MIVKTRYTTPSGIRFSIFGYDDYIEPTEFRIHVQLSRDYCHWVTLVQEIETAIERELAGYYLHPIMLKIYSNSENKADVKGKKYIVGHVNRYREIATLLKGE